ncbi:CRISPR-associated endonuclease Cas3'' [Streptomyces chartreusis]
MSSGGVGGSGLLCRLGARARSVWAKHDAVGDGWLPLWRHMEDSAWVAGQLWDGWLPGSVRGLITDALPSGEADGRQLVVWLAAVHDIGKATPAFACQVDSLAEAMRVVGLAMRSRQGMGPDRRLAPHGVAGQLLLGEWLEERCGWSPGATGQFTVAVGGHHGVPPERGQIKALDEHEELLRTPGPSREAWRQVQAELLDACAAEYGVGERLEAWRSVRLPQPVQVLLSAVVIVADWIASNPDLFPYFPDAAGLSGEERCAAAWRGLDLPEPWRAEKPAGGAQELFASRFALPAEAKVRPVQETAFDLAREMYGPGLMVIEAPMGEALTQAPWQASAWYRNRYRSRTPEDLIVLREATADEQGTANTLRDQPVSFDPAHRRHTWRTVVTTTVPVPGRTAVPARHEPFDAWEDESA